MIVSIVALYSTIDASPIAMEETNVDIDPLAKIEVNLKLDIFLKDKNTFQHRNRLNAQIFRHKRQMEEQMCGFTGCMQQQEMGRKKRQMEEEQMCGFAGCMQQQMEMGRKKRQMEEEQMCGFTGCMQQQQMG
jgi:hypothetical protein